MDIRLALISRPSLARLLIAVALAILVMLPMAASAASVPRKFAGIVVDAKSGNVLYESAADAARYPASVVKVMTLYVLFQELNAGNIRLTDKMVVSKHAANAVPTKLGLRAGSKIAVKDAILSLVTKSANDMARVIAEHISGTESEFAKRMTATAKALGMNRTTYRNASGLPDSKQITTVRDQSILAIAIYQHFPEYYKFFQTRSFSYGKQTFGNHNRLLGERGVDGIKTGYTRASGFNLMTAARPENRHVVVIAFGFDTSASRDAKVRELVKKYAGKGRNGDYLRTAMVPVPGRKGSTRVAIAEPVKPMPYPVFRTAAVAAEAMHMPDRPDPDAVRAQLENPVLVATATATPAPAPRPEDIGLQPAVQAANLMGSSSATPVPDPQDRPLDVIGAWLSESLSLGAAPAPLGQTAPSAPLVPPVGIGEGGQPIDLMTSGSVGSAPAAVAEQPLPAEITVAAIEPAAPPVSGWVVQIGAAPSETGATSLLRDASGSVAGLGNFQPYVERFEKNGQVFYRARFTGFNGREDAAAMCDQLQKAALSCLAMQS